MTLRAVLLGIFLALFISIFTYFNDHVVQQVYVISTHFPVAIFGFLLLLVLCVNPLVGCLTGGGKALTFKEIAVVLALGLAACGWPGSSFMRYFSPMITLPPTYAQTMTAWKAVNLMSYVPGASAQLGEGHIRDYPAFAKELMAASESGGPAPAARVWSQLDSGAMSLTLKMARSGQSESGERMLFLNGLNAVLANPNFFTPEAFSSIKIDKEAAPLLPKISGRTASQREVELFNRILLEESFPRLILHRPAGHGIFLADGDLGSPAVQGLIQGTGGKGHVGVGDIDWRTWWPTIRFWGGLAILMGIASLCLILIVQPQWKRELLPYPIARFVEEVTRPGAKGIMPGIMKNKLFWISFGVIFAVHICNGLNKWFPTVWFVKIPLTFDFTAIEKMMPLARQYEMAFFATTAPSIFPSVVAFAFFLAAEVSFSIGISSYLFLFFYVAAVSSGVLIQREFIEAGNAGMMRFGSYLGIALMLFFLGRRYYVNVLASCIGFRRNPDTPGSAVWAARVAAVCLAGMVVILSFSGLDWVLGSLLVGLIMLTFFVITRLNVETGTFFAQPMWGPVGVILSLFGIQAIGPSAYVVMALVCAVLVLDPRECLMPFLANGLYMATDKDKKSPSGGLTFLTGGIITLAFVVALVSVLYFQYNNGLDNQDGWATNSYGVPALVFSKVPEHISNLSSYNELPQSLSLHGLSRFAVLNPDFTMLKWALAGLLLVVVCNVLRLRLPWWPLHPVLFVVWGTMPGMRLGVSFLLGWIIKTAVVKMSGAKGYRTVLPLMVGLIAGEVAAAMLWSIAGALFFLVTSKTPAVYEIFPS